MTPWQRVAVALGMHEQAGRLMDAGIRAMLGVSGDAIVERRSTGGSPRPGLQTEWTHTRGLR